MCTDIKYSVTGLTCSDQRITASHLHVRLNTSLFSQQHIFTHSPYCRGNSTIATSWIISSQISHGVKAPAIILLKLMCLYLCRAPMIAVSEDWLMQTWPGQCFWLLRHPFNWGYWIAVADWLALVLLVKIHTDERPVSTKSVLNASRSHDGVVLCSSMLIGTPDSQSGACSHFCFSHF